MHRYILILVFLILYMMYIIIRSYNKNDGDMLDDFNNIGEDIICNEMVDIEEDRRELLKKINRGIKRGAIFVSVASYRDYDCNNTIKSIYNNAKNPEKIYVGICEQNSDDKLERCIVDGDNTRIPIGNVRIIKKSYKEARGPTYARYICSKLWDGEQYFFQIDSHTEFIKDWDEILINMLERCRKTNEIETEYKYGINGSEKPILASYPPDKSQMNLKGYTIIDDYKIKENGLPMLYSHFIREELKRPLKSKYNLCGANFVFGDYTILKDVPYDPYLGYLFQGEEYLLSARLYTHGYDIYVPDKVICSHFYKRKGNFYWNDNREQYKKCIKKTHERVKKLLNREINDEYGLGSREFYKNKF